MVRQKDYFSTMSGGFRSRRETQQESSVRNLDQHVCVVSVQIPAFDLLITRRYYTLNHRPQVLFFVLLLLQ